MQFKELERHRSKAGYHETSLCFGATVDIEVMKKLLVVCYSQSGQLTQIVRSVLRPVSESGQIEFVFEELRPRTPYPFPWTALRFADTFPESLQGTPCELEPFQFDPQADYDGIVLAYQVWYLSPSIPVNTFLKSPEAKQVIKGRPVVTVIGCRNMWLQAQEKVKASIVELGGLPAGNIVLMDRAPNLLGIISITAWMLTGNKDRFLKIFPKPGISDEDITRAERFGVPLRDALHHGRWESLQADLNRLGAVEVVPSYILFEQRILKIFNVWAKFIRRSGPPGDASRHFRLRLFIGYLFAAVFLIAPLATAVTFVLRMLHRDKVNRLIDYYASNRYPQETNG